MAKARVYEVAKELGIDGKTAVAKLQELGEFVKSASSTIEAPVARKLRDATRTPWLRLPPEGSRQEGSSQKAAPSPADGAPTPAAALPQRLRRQRLRCGTCPSSCSANSGSTGSGRIQTRSACCTSNLRQRQRHPQLQRPVAKRLSSTTPGRSASRKQPIHWRQWNASEWSASRKQSVQQWRKLRHATPRCARRPTS